jgi:hypothetical protein
MAVTLVQELERQHGLLNQMKHAPFGATGIRTNDDCVLPAWDMVFDVGNHEGFAVEVVYWNIKEALDLAGVQIHGNDVVAAGDDKHVGDELGSDRCAALVLLIHTRIRIARDDGSDAAGGSTLARGDEDEELHEVIVDVATSGLDDEDVLVANRLGNLNIDLPI